MLSSEDKCEVSEDKYKDRSDKLDRGQKGNEKTAYRGVYKDVEAEDE